MMFNEWQEARFVECEDWTASRLPHLTLDAQDGGVVVQLVGLQVRTRFVFGPIHHDVAYERGRLLSWLETGQLTLVASTNCEDIPPTWTPQWDGGQQRRAVSFSSISFPRRRFGTV